MKIIIFGIGKIAEVVYTQIKNERCFDIVGFCVDHAHLIDNVKFGLPVVAFEDVQRSFPSQQYGMLVAIGYHQLNRIRQEKCEQAIAMGYRLVSYISQHAKVASSASIGNNCVILDDVSVGPFVVIHNNVFLNCCTTIAHHSHIEDNVWVTSGAVVGGGTEIGRNTFIGINATLGHGIRIGQENFIGAGTIVTKSTANKAVFIQPDTPQYRLNVDQFLKLSHFN